MAGWFADGLRRVGIFIGVLIAISGGLDLANRQTGGDWCIVGLLIVIISQISGVRSRLRP